MQIDTREVPQSSNSSNPAPVSRTFRDELVIHALPFEDEILFLVAEAEAALGYQIKQLSNSINIWIADGKMREAAHLRKLTNGKLAAFKVLVKQHFPDLKIDARTPALLTLTEAGLYRVLMLSGKPDALAFQDWLESEVLPRLRKTGSYSVPGTAPQLTASVPAPASPALTAKPDKEQCQEIEEINADIKGWPLNALRMLKGYVNLWDGNAEAGTDYNAAMGHLMRLLLPSTPEEVAELTQLLKAARTKPPEGSGLLSAGVRTGLALALARRGLGCSDAKLLRMVSEAERQ